MKKFSLFISLAVGLLVSSCSTPGPVVVKEIIRDTIIVNPKTQKYEYTRAATLKNYKVATNHYPAKGQDDRVRFLILHYTAMENEGSIKVLTHNEVSSHYLIPDAYNDSIYLLVDETKRAWHAGFSYWKGINNLNFSSIGIEIVNNGYDESKKVTPEIPGREAFFDYPSHQIRKVAELAKDIIERYNIDPINVLGHSDIAPQRKHDPGPKFPWKLLHKMYGIGAWYDDADKYRFQYEYPYDLIDEFDFIISVQKDLEKYGYEIQKTGIWDEQTQKVIMVFQYHFRPELCDGDLDSETWAILQALNYKYRN